MESMTISQVSKSLGISTRMLRYYEQTGLIESFRQEGYAYRCYDKEAISRLEQILLLRKLRISVRQIKVILKEDDAVAAIAIFCQNISELNQEIKALSAIENILNQFVAKLSKASKLPLQGIIPTDEQLLAAVNSISSISINFKEDQMVKNLKKVDENIPKSIDVLVIYVPPATVAVAHHIGEEPEFHANHMIDQFVLQTGLHKQKPDLRHYGFNHPNPVDETGYHGYEIWVTIPEDMAVPAPLIKKQFAGGLYAAHVIEFGNFDQWNLLFDWANNSEKYEFAGDMADQEHMCGLLEEHLNYINHVELPNTEPEGLQLDLLLPLRER